MHTFSSTSDVLSHLCSRFLRLSRSEWSTRGSCHILHIGSSSCATAVRRKREIWCYVHSGSCPSLSSCFYAKSSWNCTVVCTVLSTVRDFCCYRVSQAQQLKTQDAVWWWCEVVWNHGSCCHHCWTSNTADIWVRQKCSDLIWGNVSTFCSHYVASHLPTSFLVLS